MAGGPKLATGVLIPRKGDRRAAAGDRDARGASAIGIHDGNFVLKADDVGISVKLIDGQFPPYDQVIPKDNDRAFEVSRLGLLDALKRVALMSSDKTFGVRLGVEKGKVRIESDNPDLGAAGRDRRRRTRGRRSRSGSTRATSSTCSPRSRRPRCASSCRASWIRPSCGPLTAATTSASSCRCGCSGLRGGARAHSRAARRGVAEPGAADARHRANGCRCCMATTARARRTFSRQRTTWRCCVRFGRARRGPDPAGDAQRRAAARATSGHHGLRTPVRDRAAAAGRIARPRRQGSRAPRPPWGAVSVMLFVPEDLLLPRAAPAARRRFMDLAIFNVERGYYSEASTLQKVLRSRNALLGRRGGGIRVLARHLR